MPFSLFDDFRQPGFHSSVMSTFSVDAAFYDSNIQHRLRAYGCQNNVLMADQAMLAQALEQMPEAFVNAGCKYLVCPVAVPGAFHPKLILRYGAKKARLVIASANATTAGWARNREVITGLDWSSGDDSMDAEVIATLIGRGDGWLWDQLPYKLDSNLAYKRDLILSQSPWLADIERRGGPFALADGSEIDLLLGSSGDAQGLADTFLGNIDAPIERLVIISPYWDDNLSAVHRLHTALGGPPVHIFMSCVGSRGARSSTFPLSALKPELAPSFHPIGETDERRFLHAKLILAQSEHHDYLLFGSANCTVAALGTEGRAGINAEACLYRRLPRGTVEHQLCLDFSLSLSADDIAEPETSVPEPSALPTFNPGAIERTGARLVWNVPSALDPVGAQFLIAEHILPSSIAKPGQSVATLPIDLQRGTLVVRVRLADGRISRPAIATDPQSLMAAAPNPLAANVRKKLEAVLSGEADLISLVRDMHLIFSNDAPRRAAAYRAGASGTRTSAPITGQDYASPEEFRAALGMKLSLQSDPFAHADSPALQMILKIVLRGIVSFEDQEAIQRAEANADADAALGEDQDDFGTEEDVIFAPAKSAPQETEKLTCEQFEANQSLLFRALNQYDNFLYETRESDAELNLDFVTRTLFILYLMVYGCSKTYQLDDGKEERLLSFTGNGRTVDRGSFAFMGAQLVQAIWGPKAFKDSLMARVAVQIDWETLPIQLTTLIVLSRWILAAVLAAARRAKNDKSLAGILDRQVPPLFAVTRAFGDLDQEELHATIAEMERHIGLDGNDALGVEAILTELGGAGTLRP